MNKKIKFLIALFFIILFSIIYSNAYADVECDKDCAIVNVSVNIINSTIGSLEANDFISTIWINNRTSGLGRNGGISASIVPTQFEVTSDLSNSMNYAKLKSYNKVVLSDQCSGDAKVEKYIIVLLLIKIMD